MSEDIGPVPTNIIVHKISRTLELEYATGERIVLPFSLLRAQSTSAEMRHGAIHEASDYKQVNILSIEPVGNYAIKPIFSDGHRTGIYSWHTLYQLGKKYGSGHS